MKKFKRGLKELPKKTMALLMAFSMLLNYVLPITTVFALDTYTISFSAQGTHTMEVVGGQLKIDGQFVDLQYNGTTIGEVNCSSTTSCSITASSDMAGELNYNSANKFTLYNSNGHVEYVMGNLINSDTVFMVEDKINEPQAGGTEDVTFDINFTNTHMNVWINNKVVMDDHDGILKSSFNGEVTSAGNATGTNSLRFQPPFGDYPVTEYVINGISYTEDSANVTVDMDGSFIIDVPVASSYTITGSGDESYVLPRTIIWTNSDYVPKDEEDAAWTSQFSIGHGSAKVIEVYDENGTLLAPNQYINTVEQPDGSRSDQYGVNNGFGWVSIMPGSRVVFEFVPEYGYQLTGISINEQPLEAIETTNRFEITLPQNPEGSGNIHFAATFTRTEDIVKAGSEKVSGGSINLGNELPSGSAQLTVNDVELSSDKISEFENAAGEYTISNYLDIDLYQVFYKGKNDSNDVWSTEIEELSDYATISMKLEDGIDANDIVIVHNIHDGDEYEVIEIESYDPETNTITFKTKSFSNYAIATKTSTQTDNNSNSSSSSATTSTTSNPQTGDNITTYFITLLLSIAGLTGASLIVNKRRKFARN